MITRTAPTAEQRQPHPAHGEALRQRGQEEHGGQEDRVAHVVVALLPGHGAAVEGLAGGLLQPVRALGVRVVVLGHEDRPGRGLGVVEGVRAQPRPEGRHVLGPEAAPEEPAALWLPVLVARSHELKVVVS